MRVLRIIDEIGRDSFSGPARHAYLLTEALARRGVKNDILTFRAGPFHGIENISVETVKPDFARGNLRFSRELFRRALTKSPDVVHVHGYRTFTSDIGLVLSEVKDIPFVITTHGTVLGYKQGSYGIVSSFPNRLYDLITGQAVLRRASAIVVTSYAEMNDLATTGIRRSKLRLIPHGIQIPRAVRLPVEEPGGLLTALMCIKFTKPSNLELAIKGFALAAGKDDRLRLKIMGDVHSTKGALESIRYKERIIRLIKESGVEDKVILTGWLRDDALWDAYASASIFLVTSLYGNFGQPFVEAAHFALPIISTPIGIATELIGRNGGEIVPADDPQALSNAILRLSGSWELRRAMGEYCAIKSSKYTVEAMVKSYIGLYNEVLDSKSP